MALIINCMHAQTRTTDQFLLASSKHNANLSILKKNLISTSYRSKRSNIHISCSVGLNTTPTTQQETEKLDPAKRDIRRSQFPPNFMFGAGSAAYQVEGAWNEGGKGPSIWDTFAHEHPNKIKDGSNGDVALDMYHRYKDDVQLMKKMGLDSYRFSISWPRILPNGTLKGGINKEGIMYYNNLINELIKNGITPFVTLFHWDVPQALENKYHGFLSKEILNDFKDYCQICFQEFGDRVKHWTTLNEPYVFTCFGYSSGKTAPGHCSDRKDCPTGDSLTEPYKVSHHLLLAHATAVQLYRNHFKSIQGGEIGIVLNCTWYKLYADSIKDKDAQHRALEFMLGWYMEPLAKGEYPYIMRELVGQRLPEFKQEESDMIKGSFDFIGLNYYSSSYAKDVPKTFSPAKSLDDSWVEGTAINKDGAQIGPQQGTWVYMVPDGLPELLTYTKKKYDVPKLYVTENGTMQLDYNDNQLPVENAISDQDRVDYMFLHLKELRDAIDNGLNVAGYFVWSLMDNYEWMSGYTNRFGLLYIDHKNNLSRIPKKSADWYTEFLHS